MSAEIPVDALGASRELRPQFTPVVYVYHNPWSLSLEEGVIRMRLTTAAIDVAQQLQEMIDTAVVDPGDRSFVWVMLDPTRPNGVHEPRHLVVASVEIGEGASRYFPYAVAKADAHRRHGCSMSTIMESNNLLLGDGDVAYTGSVEYRGVIAAGSGLREDQDQTLALRFLRQVVEGLKIERATWLDGQRAAHGSHGWWNSGNLPSDRYKV